jgi:hypothetical protein
MSVKIIIDENSIKAKIDNTWENGLEMLSSQILKDCNYYCKEDTGMLIMSSFIHSDLKHGRLIWNTPYAARQYYEIRTAYKDVNSNASWRWCEVAKQNHISDWQRQAQAITRLYK